MQIKDPIIKLPGIGPKTKIRLGKLGINTAEDLLYHFPFRYEDRSHIEPIASLHPQKEKVAIKGKIFSINSIYTKSGKNLIKATAKDATGKIQLIWFNMPYLAKTVRVGETYLFYGQVESYNGKLTLMSPEIDEKDEHTGIIPIYQLTEGIRQKWLRLRINDLLSLISQSKENQDPLPSKIVQKRNLLAWNKAIKNIHFPENFEILQKAQKRLAYEELFTELYQSSAITKKWKDETRGFILKKPSQCLKLPFLLTPDQQKAVEEIALDMEKPTPMNRLLEGDVGTGKTIVAIMAAYQALVNGKTTLYLAPTEILAQQHFQTFQNILGDFCSDIFLVTGNTKHRSATKTKDESRTNPNPNPKTNPNPHIQIGTHAILYQNQTFENLGLVVIDEQHRFGVEQRVKLLSANKNGVIPHLLTMTATPIPRTLALSIYGDLDISYLKEHPNQKRQIITKVVPPQKQDSIFVWIAKHNLSAFVVCPFIEESGAENLEQVKAVTAEFERLKTFFPCSLLHGKMSSEKKSAVIQDFRDGKIKVLVSTQVVEVGIDVPNADVMVIESAERYGLASLHQLRGRVGRGNKKGYCFVFPSSFSKNSYIRLKHLENTLDGLELAEIDLRMRGQGDIFGTLQHGFLDFKLANINDLDFVRMVREDVNEILENSKEKPKTINLS